MLNKVKLPHSVLNAKQHAREAEIVAEAGKPGHITIATNLAGRGTDIVLGGSVEKQLDLLRADDSPTAEEKEARIASVKTPWEPANAAAKAPGGLRPPRPEQPGSPSPQHHFRGHA